jgi:hybrid cluster-associated redox disulfide protein
MEINPQTTVFELLKAYPQAAPLFLRRRMACVGCDMSRFETLKDATGIYRVDLNLLLEEIRELVIQAE